MKRHSLAVGVSLALICVATSSQAQVDFEKWILNLDGTTTGCYKYTDPQGTHTGCLRANVSSLQYDSNYIYISSTDVPAYEMDFPQPRYPGVQTVVAKIPRSPSAATTKTALPTGAIALLVNGVELNHPGDGLSWNTSTSSEGNTNAGAGQGIWNRSAVYSEAGTYDTCYGHTSGTSPGVYHLHQYPQCLLSYFGDNSSTHSPIIGWSFDGYPIYGPYGYCSALDSSSGICRMKSSYQLRNITQRQTLPADDGSGGTTALPSTEYGPDVSSTYPLGRYLEDYEWISGLGDLDDSNGRYCVTPEYPNGTYAYFITIDSGGNSAYPYVIGRHLYGNVATGPPKFNALNQTVPAGATEFQPSCPVTVTPSATTALPSTSMTASVPDSGTGSTYAWTITNGTITGGSSTRTVSFTTNGSGLTTTVSASVRTPWGCTATGSADIAAAYYAPANFSAVLNAATTAALSWTASAGASQYVIYRRSAGTGWVERGTTSSTSFSDSTLTSDAAFIYEVQAANADRSIVSTPSLDYVTTFGYTDDPPVAGSTEIKAQHITELRAAIEALDALLSVTPPTWTDTSLSGVAVKATHFLELRAGINAFRSALPLSTYAFTDSTLTSGSTVIQKVHLSELRVAVKGYCINSNCQ